jgi:hypothetical protein
MEYYLAQVRERNPPDLKVKRVRDKARSARANRHEALKTCMPQGHPDYRFICQEMWRKIKEVHPALAEAGKFIDWQKYRLGRLQSEMRTEFKKSTMEKHK